MSFVMQNEADEEFHECFEIERQLSDSILDDVQWISMDIQDADETGGDFRVGMVKSEAVVLTLDSGADVSHCIQALMFPWCLRSLPSMEILVVKVS